MTENTEDKNRAAEERSQDTRRFVRQVRSATRRKYTPEEKIHIVLQGFLREDTVNELCRREGIKPANFYSWTKEFMEAGKQRLSRDTTRDATRQEIDDLKRESADLKALVAELSLDLHRLKKTAMPTLGESRPYKTPIKRHEKDVSDPPNKCKNPCLLEGIKMDPVSGTRTYP